MDYSYDVLESRMRFMCEHHIARIAQAFFLVKYMLLRHWSMVSPHPRIISERVINVPKPRKVVTYDSLYVFSCFLDRLIMDAEHTTANFSSWAHSS